MLDLPGPDEDALQRQLREVEKLLSKQQLVEDLTRRQQMPHQRLVENITHRQNLARLQRRLDRLHPADIADILEGLPVQERLVVWDLVRADKDGEILLEVSNAVRSSLLATMEPGEIKVAAESLDADELADLISDLPEDLVQEVLDSLDQREQAQVREVMSYPEGTVGALMDFDLVKVREDIRLEVVSRYLRRFDAFPDHTDKLFVIDRDERLRGILSLEALLINEPEAMVSDVMDASNLILFRPEDEARQAASAFERYDLV